MRYHAASLTLLCLVLFAHAQHHRCEWHLPRTTETRTHEWVDWRDSTHYFDVRHTFVAPVDMNVLDGQTFQAPANVTRIGRQSLAVKDESFVDGADIYYMIDGSGSMWWGSENIAVITYEGDTLYRVQGTPNTATLVGTVTKLIQDQPQEYEIFCCADIGDLYRVPGDPFYESWGMMKEGILLQRDLVTNAYAGFMPFAGRYKYDDDPASGSHDYYTPLANVSKGHPDAIANLLALWHLGRNEFDGRYHPGPTLPLAKARRAQWTVIQTGLDYAMEELQTNGQTANRAVIVFSDGEVHDVTPEHLSEDKIDSYPYPVYPISLQSPKTPYITMPRIAEGTGGKHFDVPNADQDSLATVMQEIIARITGARVPVRAALTNASLDPPRTSVSMNMGFDRNPDGSGWTITLDSVLALAEGTNEITLALTYYDGATGQRETTAASFTIEVGDAAPDEQYLTCYERPTLTATSSSGDALLDPATDSSFTVTMRAAAFDLIGRLNPAIATSVNSGDRLVVALDTTIAKDSGAYPYETFTTTCRYSGAAAEPGDGILQSGAEDIVLLRWEHPRDPRDTAVLAIATTGATLTPPSADPASGTYEGAPLLLTLTNAASGVPADIYYSVDGAAFVRYIAPLPLDPGEGEKTYTVRAYASLGGPLTSDTVTLTYTVTGGGTAVLPQSYYPVFPAYEQSTDEPRGDDPAPADRAAAVEPVKHGRIMVRPKALFSPDDRIPPSILANLRPGPAEPPERGTMIQVSAPAPVRSGTSRADIYDAVGNLVAKGLPLYAGRDDPTRGWFLWNGRTRAGRVAGAGTYLAVVRVELADGTRRTKRIRLGVR